MPRNQGRMGRFPEGALVLEPYKYGMEVVWNEQRKVIHLPRLKPLDCRIIFMGLKAHAFTLAKAT